MLLASYFSLPSSFCLVDPLKEGLQSLCVSLISIVMAPLPFFAEFRDGSYGLNTKRSSMEHPQCTCGRLVMPELQMVTHRAASEGPVDPGPKSWGNLVVITSTPFLLSGFPQDRKSSDKDCFHLVITMTLCYLVQL